MKKRMEQKQMKKIGIIGAMELEVETLKSKMNVAKTTPVSQVLWTHRSISGISLFPQMSFSMTWMSVYSVIR